jgi:hypothetical protein
MSQLNAINQELLRQINDSVGYKIKTKIDSLISSSGGDHSNINYIAASTATLLTTTGDTLGGVNAANGKLDTILLNTANALTDSSNISYLVTRSRDDTSNVNYLTEATVINDTSLASTVSKSLDFHKFLTTEHIPAT